MHVLQNGAVAMYMKKYQELLLFFLGWPIPQWVLKRYAESWVAHMVCCGWYLCASLQTSVPSLGRGSEIRGDLRMVGKMSEEHGGTSKKMLL